MGECLGMKLPGEAWPFKTWPERDDSDWKMTVNMSLIITIRIVRDGWKDLWNWFWKKKSLLVCRTSPKLPLCCAPSAHGTVSKSVCTLCVCVCIEFAHIFMHRVMEWSSANPWWSAFFPQGLTRKHQEMHVYSPQWKQKLVLKALVSCKTLEQPSLQVLSVETAMLLYLLWPQLREWVTWPPSLLFISQRWL